MIEMSIQKPEDLLSVVISAELPPSPNSRQLFINQDQQVRSLPQFDQVRNRSPFRSANVRILLNERSIDFSFNFIRSLSKV